MKFDLFPVNVIGLTLSFEFKIIQTVKAKWHCAKSKISGFFNLPFI